jgi:hypothetical protein
LFCSLGEVPCRLATNASTDTWFADLGVRNIIGVSHWELHRTGTSRSRGVALGSGAGAAVGLGAWFALGTIGVATGGVGLAIGAVGMASIGALFGGIGGASGGLGIREVSYWFIHPVIWIPLLVLGAYFIWGHRLKKSRGQKNTDL